MKEEKFNEAELIVYDIRSTQTNLDQAKDYKEVEKKSIMLNTSGAFNIKIENTELISAIEKTIIAYHTNRLKGLKKKLEAIK